MGTFFRHDLRVVPCDTCGAPIEGANAGGRVTCRYCRAEQDLTPREEAPLAIGPRLPEAERLAALRRQDAFARPTPASLGSVIFGERLVPWEVPEALARWQMARRALGGRADPNAAEELFALTEALGAHYERQGAWLEARALAEGALDELTEPRHRQALRAFLAREAALTGDVAAGEAWLAGCDARAAELESDGAYRLARACIDTVRGDPARVLETLGNVATDVALPNDLDPAAALLRANAWERLGRPDQAADLLVHLAEHGGPVFHLKAHELAERYPELRLCEQSARLAEARIQSVWQARSLAVGSGPWGCFFAVGVGIVLASLAVLIAMLALALGVADAAGFALGDALASAGSVGLFVLSFVSMIGTVFALSGAVELSKAKKARRLRSVGRLLPGAVVQCMATGNAAMGKPEVSVRVLVLDDSSAYLASTETYVDDPEASRFARGAAVALRIDRDDPHVFALVF